jgi:glycerophosphoryl diester phosphodiesterase
MAATDTGRPYGSRGIVTVTTYRRAEQICQHTPGAPGYGLFRPTSRCCRPGQLSCACHTASVTAYLAGEPPRAFAHRGWHVGELAGLENTTAAFRRAFDEGYRYLETDARATSDGVLIAFHDPRLDRVTDRTGLVAKQPWSEVKLALVGGGQQIPLLAELLEELPDACFNIDAKAANAVGPLAELIRRTGAGDRVCVVSFSERRLAAVRAAVGPDVAWAMGPFETFRLFRASKLRRSFGSAAVAVQVPVTFQRVRIVTPEFIAAAHAAGLEVHVWTINDPAEMRELLAMGADGIMTDRPELLREVMIERGAWH